MIAVDTCSLIAFLGGEEGEDSAAVKLGLQNSSLVLPPAVLMEALSDPAAKEEVANLLSELPILDLHEGYWQRAAKIRRAVLGMHFKARLADALIAQSCIDHQVPLITRDRDFRHYEKHCGLKLYV